MEKLFSQPRMSSSQSHFAKTASANIPRSVFDRSHGIKTTFNAGDLVPIYIDEVLPGDSFKLRATTFARLATPVAPLMDNLYADLFFFYVPNRLLWSNWERFNGAQDNPTDSTDFEIPVISSTSPGGYSVGSLHDYFGLPTGVATLQHSALFHRAYNLIWNEWFRDQNLQTSVTVNLGDGPDVATDYALLKRGKRHDYFTSALPWTQKGDAVTLPLGTTATVIRTSGNTDAQLIRTAANGNLVLNSNSLVSGGSGQLINSGAQNVVIDPNGTWQADLSNATAATINQLRQAFQMQGLFERDARGGTRYVEILKAHFGVTSPDFRLQRPEFIGGGSTMINTQPIPQTSSTDGTSPQGNLAAMGMFSHAGNGFAKSFVEHGVLIGLISVRADLTYQQGLNRMWSRSTRYDFYWPGLAHLGEQTILNKEIYAQGSADANADAGVFGYQERYAEYRYKPSQVTGQFRSTYATPLDYWHLAQKFTALPTLGPTFIVENPPMSRVKAVTTEPDFLLDVAFDLKCARPMPVYSVPGLIDKM